MKNIIILLTFLWAITSYAVAPYGIKGQQQAATLYSNVHQFPNNQVTNLGGINALVETGNTNILSNPSFEHSTFSTSWTNSAGTFTQETSVVIDGKASAKLVLSAQTMSLTQSSTLYAAQFADGVQGLAMVRIKSDIALSVCSIQAGTVSTTNCVTTNTDSKWGLYKVPFILGATSNGISIASTGSTSGTVYLDDAFVGAINLESQNGACITEECTTEFSFKGSLTGVVSDENIDFINGSGVYSAGLYTYTFNTPMATAPNCSTGQHQASGTTIRRCLINATSTTSVQVACLNDFAGIQIAHQVVCQRSGADFTQAEAKKTGNVFTTQCGANCVDTFSAKISVTGAVSEENVNWINGNGVLSGGGSSITTLTYNTNIFTVAPNCTVSADGGVAGDNSIILATSNISVSVRGYTTTIPTNAAKPFIITCQKQGADFVATRNIVGSFNEVVTSPGISKPKVCYYQFGGASNTLACTASPCSEYVDNCSSGTVPTRLGVGLYAFDISAGTFANNSFLNCFCSATGGSIECAGVGIATSNSSGGASLAPRTFTNAGAASDQYPTITCIGSAP